MPVESFLSRHLFPACVCTQVILLERGQPVEVRGKDIGALFVRRRVNQESNLCYGEGGAGTRCGTVRSAAEMCFGAVLCHSNRLLCQALFVAPTVIVWCATHALAAAMMHRAAVCSVDDPGSRVFYQSHAALVCLSQPVAQAPGATAS